MGIGHPPRCICSYFGHFISRWSRQSHFSFW
jgi:hypothetical protein